MRSRRVVPLLALFMFCVTVLEVRSAWAAGGPLGIDSRMTYDNSGIWKRQYQTDLELALVAAPIVSALWEGGESRFGRTLWQSVDAEVIGSISSEVLKRVFSRKRPRDTPSPNQWFKGGGNQSFPSGEVTLASSVVTPLVLEYGNEHPAVYALEILPVYDAIARMKVWGHWQTDVLAGFGLGAAAGYIAHRHGGTPWVLSIMPGGVYVGLKKQF